MSDVKTLNYEDEEYKFDLEEIDVAQATVIFEKTGLTLLALENGLDQGNPHALKAIFWLMMVQNGKKLNFDATNFKIVKFARALNASNEAEEAAAKAAAETDKAPAPKGGGEEPTQA